MTISDKNIRDIISRSLGQDDLISESFVAQQKSFDLTTEYLSADNKRNHLDLYDIYVKDFNKISANLDAVSRQDVSSNFSAYRDLKIDETYNMNATYLHELYFSNISDLQSNISMASLSYIKLQAAFGTFDEWQRDFVACCLASRCGWAYTYFNTFTKSYMNASIDLHSLNVPVGSYPLIVMDVWQHAYYRDYLKDVKTYVYAMMKQLNWDVINSRFEKAEKIAQVLR